MISQIIYYIVNIVITIYLWNNYPFRDVLFFWLLSGICYQLWIISRLIVGFYQVFRYVVRVATMHKFPGYEAIQKSAMYVNSLDGDRLSIKEYNKTYELLGQMTGANVWKDKNNIVTDISIRNIVAFFIGISDNEVKKSILKKHGIETE